jgi:hypothetical protein
MQAYISFLNLLATTAKYVDNDGVLVAKALWVLRYAQND